MFERVLRVHPGQETRGENAEVMYLNCTSLIFATLSNFLRQYCTNSIKLCILVFQFQVEVKLWQESSGSEAVVVWDAALVLAFFLQKHREQLDLHTGPKRVLELGAGTGVVGIVAAIQG